MIGLGRFGRGIGLAAIVMASTGLPSSALGESFYLEDGQVIEGVVVRGTLNVLVLSSGNKRHLTSVAQIERVVVPLQDGREISGELLSWKDGVFEIRSGNEVLRIADGELLEGEDTGTAIAEATTEVVPESPSDLSDGTVAMRGLPTFTFKNGETVVGRILLATGSIVTIRPQGGSASPFSKSQIDTVSFSGDDGQQVVGKLIDWEDGVYRLEIDNRELLVSLPDDGAAAPAKVASEVEQADAAVLPTADADTSDPIESAEDEVGVGGPANETAIAGLAEGAEVAAAGQHIIETLVSDIDEGNTPAIVRFQLDKPAERPLVVLYAATEASAKDGEDFEAKSGVITFATGSDSAELEVPVIDDDQGESSETFNLFLSGDPETILFSKRKISVTINDDD